MLQPRRRLNLGQEPFAAECRREILVHDLDRDLAIVLQVMREVNSCHPDGTEFPLDAVAIGKGCLESIG